MGNLKVQGHLLVESDNHSYGSLRIVNTLDTVAEASLTFWQAGESAWGVGAGCYSAGSLFTICSTAADRNLLTMDPDTGNTYLYGNLKIRQLDKNTSPTCVPTFIGNDSANGFSYSLLSDLTVGNATKISVTDTTPSSATSYYLLYTSGRTGYQSARANVDLFYYDTGEYGYLNIGSANQYGGLTLKSGKGSSIYADLVATNITAYRNIYLPDASGVLLNSGNYTTYTVTKTGSGASGTWEINTTGTWQGYSPSSFALASHTHSYLPLSGGTMSGNIILPKNKSIIQHQNDTSNYTVPVVWYKGGVSQATYNPQIGHHNTGDTYGAMILVPYATDTSPWEATIGLYLSKTRLLYNGSSIFTASNYTNWVPTKTGSGASGTWGISITGNADTVDGYHADGLAKQVHLGSIGDYQEAVIGLFPVATSNNTGSGNFASGKISCNRVNGLYETYWVDFTMNDSYYTGGSFYCNRRTNTPSGLQPCTFLYNGTRWAGFHQRVSSAQCNVNIFIGYCTHTPFMVVHYNHNDGTVYNSEIYNSLRYDTVLEGGTFINGGIYQPNLCSGIWIDSNSYGSSLPGGSTGRIFFLT